MEEDLKTMKQAPTSERNRTLTTATQDVATVEGCINNDEFGMLCVVRLECKCCTFSNTLIKTHRHLSLDLVDSKSGATFSAEHMPSTTQQTCSLDASLAHYFQPTTVERKCESCNQGTHATKTIHILKR